MPLPDTHESIIDAHNKHMGAWFKKLRDLPETNRNRIPNARRRHELEQYRNQSGILRIVWRVSFDSELSASRVMAHGTSPDAMHRHDAAAFR